MNEIDNHKPSKEDVSKRIDALVQKAQKEGRNVGPYEISDKRKGTIEKTRHAVMVTILG